MLTSEHLLDVGIEMLKEETFSRLRSTNTAKRSVGRERALFRFSLSRLCPSRKMSMDADALSTAPATVSDGRSRPSRGLPFLLSIDHFSAAAT